MITEALRELSYNRITKIGFILFGAVLAPSMFIFQFRMHIFNKSSIIPFLLIALCISFPIVLLLFILQVLDYAALDPEDPVEKLNTRFDQMAKSAIFAGVGFYLPCCIKFFDQSLDFPRAIQLMGAFLFSIAISSCISIVGNRTKKLHDHLSKSNEENKKS